MVERVSLYRAPTTAADADAVAGWLRGRIDAAVDVRGRLLEGFEDIAPALADARVRSPGERETGVGMAGAVRYEERVIAEPERGGGVLYDGGAVQAAINARLPDPDLDHLHLALLPRHLGTWGGDGRWHKRICVLGQPALVSVPGLYEAPAKPEAYYEAKGASAMLSGDTPPREVLEAEVEGEFLIEDDPRTTDAIKGPVLAAVHLLETGEAFCPEPGCRLHDAHRQEQLIEDQLREPAFCPEHAERYA